MGTSHASTVARRVHRWRLAAAFLVAAAALGACAGDTTDPDDGAPPTAVLTEQPTDPASVPGRESRQEAEAETPEKVAPNPLPTPPDLGEEDSSPPDEEDGVVSSGEDRVVPESGNADSDAVPPEFYAPDSLLVEDAFDGADLVLDGVDLAVRDVSEVVFGLDGSGFPGWHVEYVDPAQAPVDAGAESVLKVALVGVGSTSAGARNLPAADGPVTQLVVKDGAEGVTAYVALARKAAPFRVYLQHAPLRLVVDVAAGA